MHLLIGRSKYDELLIPFKGAIASFLIPRLATVLPACPRIKVQLLLQQLSGFLHLLIKSLAAERKKKNHPTVWIFFPLQLLSHPLLSRSLGCPFILTQILSFGIHLKFSFCMKWSLVSYPPEGVRQRKHSQLKRNPDFKHLK